MKKNTQNSIPNHTEMDTSAPQIRNPKNAYHIGGIPVEFPYQPYGSQLAFMGRVISTLDRAQRDGSCHGLLESPTGTGKTLSLLCSVLAWQKNYQSKNISANPAAYLRPDLEARTDPLGYGGGFVPESQPSASGNPEPVLSATSNSSSKKKTAPTIFYASRTHGQITQVIREYKKTTYRVPMAVLASRKHYCTNTHVHGQDNIDEECKLLLKDPDVGCPEFKNVNKIKGHLSLRKGGCHEVHDIEDLVKVGQAVKGCAYFAARSMAEDAQIVFCPYNYIVNPVIRRAMEVDIKGAILILDEAHNIEDMSREAGSVDVDEDVLHKLQTELGQLTFADATIYQPLYEMIQDIISWMERRESTLEKREFQHYFSCWSGDKALRELEEANISRQCFPILLDCATKAIKDASEMEMAHLTGMSAITLEGNVAAVWTYTFSLWCMNPAVVFRGIADLSLSVILTSGTLSPMNSFSSELGVQFGTCLEAPHVIDVDSQAWAAVISTGPGNFPLNASYKTADGFAFQDALGTSLEEICKIVPGGSLIFFPSYKLMEKLCNRWRETEPRGGSQDDFEPMLKDYYDTISGSKKPAVGRKRRGKKLGLNTCDSVDCAGISKEGAAFLAVCRGKVSEGLDFSDENARAVIIVGIPFPNINDIQIAQKKKYNDTYKSSRNLLSGSEWYCQQTFRALNQAADERFREERNRTYISKWLRKSIRQYDSFDKSLEELQSFFRDVKLADANINQVFARSKLMQERFGKVPVSGLPNPEVDEENISGMPQGKGSTRKRNQKLSKPNKCGSKLNSNDMTDMDETSSLCQSPTCATKYDATSMKSKSEDNDEVQVLQLTDAKYTNCSREYIDLKSSSRNDFRCSGPLSMTFTNDDPEVTIVKETPSVDVNLSLTNPQSFSKDENSCTTIIQAPSEFPDHLLHSTSPSISNAGHFLYSSPLAVTPERNFTRDANRLLADPEWALNLSVNSHIQKRRKSVGSTLVNLARAQQFDASDCTFNDPQSITGNDSLESCKSSSHVLEKGLQIFCSLCRNPLGLPENHLFVRCSETSSSKTYLAALLKGRFEDSGDSKSIDIRVVISDLSSVDQRLFNRTHEGALGQGVWCREDGCVFNTILCPFCTSPENCLGVRVMATDASNLHLLDKIMFYQDRLEIKNLEASKEKDISPVSGSVSDCAAPILIEKFSYIPSQKNPEGWRTTRSKVQLSKRRLLPTSRV
ncbi:hypothetical protein RHMOL_Rhmol06G0014000 [Rhododendron molle]|uniref:Uncharacterized protein n=1 Tax=Rhododendron molle TaxID=49168 RepID=A0ACC0N978_RHOML|nr:hypothetical protein RHMOL_Rhmol06G0014000 [Rhododendron molle]